MSKPFYKDFLMHHDRTLWGGTKKSNIVLVLFLDQEKRVGGGAWLVTLTSTGDS